MCHRRGAPVTPVRDEALKRNIVLHYLPPYSPNLNPIERLWKVMNENVRNNVFFTSAKHFRDSISEFFDTTILKIGQSLRGRINDNFQTIKPVPSGWMGIEGACRHYVKDRMERAGMRWTVKGAQAMLNMRSVNLNGNFDEFNQYRIKQQTKKLYPHANVIAAIDWPIAAWWESGVPVTPVSN